MFSCRLSSFSLLLLAATGPALTVFLLGRLLAAQARDQSLDVQHRGHGSHKLPAQERPGATLLIASTSEFDFGILPKGGRKRANFRLRNPTDASVEVTCVRASCECLRVELERKLLLPGDEVDAVVEVNFSDDPGFTGRFILDAKGTVGDTALAAFAICVQVVLE